MIDQACPTEKEALHNTDIHLAVFNGSKEITPKMYEEVEQFSAYVAEHQNNKNVPD